MSRHLPGLTTAEIDEHLGHIEDGASRLASAKALDVEDPDPATLDEATASGIDLDTVVADHLRYHDAVQEWRSELVEYWRSSLQGTVHAAWSHSLTMRASAARVGGTR